MLKYLFAIIFGIILFLWLNYIDKFNIGGVEQFTIVLPEHWEQATGDQGDHVDRKCPAGVGRTILKSQLLGYEIDIDIGYLQAYVNEHEGNAPIGNIVENIWTFTDDDLKAWLSILRPGIRSITEDEKRSRKDLLKGKKSRLYDIKTFGYGVKGSRVSQDEGVAEVKMAEREYQEAIETEGKGLIIDETVHELFKGENDDSSSPEQKKNFWLYIIFNMCTYRDSEIIGLINRLDGAAAAGGAAAGGDAAGGDAMDEGEHDEDEDEGETVPMDD